MRKDERRVRQKLSYLSVLVRAAFCLLVVCALSGLTLAQEEKAPATHTTTDKSSRDPLSKSKGGTRAKGGKTAEGDETAAAATTTATATETGPPAALDPANRTFIVDTDVTVEGRGTECNLTPGDVIVRLTDTPDAGNLVKASVSASKEGDCAAGASVLVKADELQEMYNHFQEQLDSGVGRLANKQGAKGMPKAPDTGTNASDVPAPKKKVAGKAPKEKVDKPSSPPGGPSKQ
jgi:hypothetical protein